MTQPTETKTKICEHNSFQVEAIVTKLKDQEDSEIISEYRLDATVKCTECGSQFEFKGLPRGWRKGYPTVNADGTEFSCPIEINL